MPGPEPEISDTEVLRLIVLHPEPVVVAGDLVDELGVTRTAVNKRLATLVEEGLLESRKVGASAKIYWLTDEGREVAAQAE